MQNEILAMNLRDCISLQIEKTKINNKLGAKTDKMAVLLDRFITSNVQEYCKINTYYKINYVKTTFIVRVYYAYDGTLAAMTKFKYAELIDFNRELEAKAKVYSHYVSNLQEDELRAVYDVLKDKFDEEEYLEEDYNYDEHEF